MSSSLVLVGKISGSGTFDAVFGTKGIVEYPVDSIDGSGTSAEITNVSLSGAHSDHEGSNGGAASDLYIVHGTAGTSASAFVDYPMTGGIPDIANPTTTQTGTFAVPSDFASMQGFTFDSRGQILVSGDTSSNKEMLTAIGGSRALGY